MTEVSIPLYSPGIIKVQAAALLNTLMSGKKIPELIFPISSHFLMGKEIVTTLPLQSTTWGIYTSVRELWLNHACLKA